MKKFIFVAKLKGVKTMLHLTLPNIIYMLNRHKIISFVTSWGKNQRSLVANNLNNIGSLN